jgi:putative heme transporter
MTTADDSEGKGMSETTDPTADAARGTAPDGVASDDTGSSDTPALVRRVPRIGIWSWSFVGFVVAAAIVFTALGAVSEIALPMTFAAVLAVIFKPLVGKLERHKIKPTLAAGLIVLGLIAVMIGVLVGTVRGVIDQADEISAVTDKALNELADQTDALGVDKDALNDARVATEDSGPMIAEGVLAAVVSGFHSLIAIASGVILGALIMYYLLKDGSKFRRSVVTMVNPGLRSEVDGFIGDSCRILRDYGQGRTVMSAIVAVVIGIAALILGLPLVFTIIVVNFIGGYIPYIGAFLGGGLAVIVALGDGGLAEGVIMLVVVLAANLVLENFVEPKVMGRSLDIHPLIVLVVTALGGLLGGIVGLILAVPAWVIARNAISRARSRGMLDEVAKRAQPAVHQMLD